jgi:hypothetical protein
MDESMRLMDVLYRLNLTVRRRSTYIVIGQVRSVMVHRVRCVALAAGYQAFTDLLMDVRARGKLALRVRGVRIAGFCCS